MELQDGGFESVTVDAMPMTRTSTLETQASVLENHSILLAGYMRDIKESAGWGIPYLRDIPWIGWLFGGASYRDETVQRLFILTPYIVDADSPDLVRDQATRQRDITLEEKLESDKDADDAERAERNAQLEEERLIREEKYKERHHRNSKEREFKREQRKDAQKESRKVWQKDFDERKGRYAEEKEKRKAAEK
jgi:type II secretory pathway component GspD/PulD (secretin)